MGMPINSIKKKLQTSLSKLFGTEQVRWQSTYLNDIPNKFERHGDLVVFSSSAFSNSVWKDIDHTKLWKCIADAYQVKRIAQQDKVCPDGIRTPSVVMLLGDNPWVTHIDNKIKYSFDVTKCMFSSGNITEKMRMARVDCKDEIIVDMFAGIGYFTLPLLVHGKAKLVHACEWNPNAVTALQRNLVDNKVADRCIVYEGDNRKVVPCGVADRVVLGLIPTAEGSYTAACSSLNQDTGGILHIHGNVTSNVVFEKIRQENSSQPKHANIDCTNMTCNRQIKPEWLAWAIETTSLIQQILCKKPDKEEEIKNNSKDRGWFMTLLHIERVKSYAPHIDHLVLDLKCFPIG